MRIAVGGIHTECSTFSPIRTTLSDFRILRGQELLDHPDFAFLCDFSPEVLSTLHARAIPGGPVSGETYQDLKHDFLARLAASLPLDGLYLAMHGAMYVEGLEDAEGDWITAARKTVGDACLISASYDLHGNLSQRIVDAIDMFSAYRTAPHVDVLEAQKRAYSMLVHCLEEGVRPAVVWVPIPVLVSGERSSTENEPARGLYELLPSIDAVPGVMDASLLVGYVWADEPRATASAVLTGTHLPTLEREARKLAQRYWLARERFSFGVPTGTIDECVAHAIKLDTRPVILADSGDNPTAGGSGDRADVLRSLLDHDARHVLVAGIAAPAATDLCYSRGEGAELHLAIGAELDPQGSEPVHMRVQIAHLSSAPTPSERQAVVTSAGITIVLTHKRRPFHYLADFAHLELDLDKYAVLVVKSGYLSPDLRPLANPNLLALSPGVVDQNIENLSYERWFRPKYPIDRDFAWSPEALVSSHF